MRVLILGGYGLIGSVITRRLLRDGHDVVGLGRSPDTGQKLIPAARWISADIARLVHANDWSEHLTGIDAVVNASGALQDGKRDDLKAVQQDSIIALIKACEMAGVTRFVQISATGAHDGASTAFMRTKAAADSHLRQSTLEWIILRPGLVIARAAYGGTSLLRALSAVPYLGISVLGNSPIQTISVDDVADAVSQCLVPKASARQTYDLVESQPHRLRDIIAAYRSWAGFSKPAMTINLPVWIARVAGRGADLCGWLGWRSPLRTTALKVLEGGVTGQSDDALRLLGRPVMDFQSTLDAMPSTIQDRWFARMMLLYPVIVFGLAAFWLASGIIGFVSRDLAAQNLADAPVAYMSDGLVMTGSVADIALGLLVLWRPTARLAAKGMFALTFAYLMMGSILTPDLWLDPLGVFVKSMLLLVLPLILLVLLEER